jgi:hypothetical protein
MSNHGGRATPHRPPRRCWRPHPAVLVAVLALKLALAGRGGNKGSGVASLGDRATAATSPGGSRNNQQARWCSPAACASTASTCPIPTLTSNGGNSTRPPGWDAAW